MKVKLVGVRALDFTSDDKKEIKGTKIYVLAPAPNVLGFMPYDFFISNVNDNIISIKLADFIGKDIDLEVDLKGKPLCVSAV